MTINIDAVLRQMQRNPFFMPSGFTLQEKINIAENRSNAKRELDKIKERKRAEKKLHNLAKIRNKCTRSKKSTKSFQIQRGFDLARKWGWGGTSKTYNPKLMKAR